MTFSRLGSVRRVLKTTLLLVGLSLTLSPEIQAQEPIGKCPNIEEGHPDYEECQETYKLSLLADDFKGFRLGGCVGIDTSCLLAGIKVGHSGERVGYLIEAPYLDVELIGYLSSFQSDALAYRRVFVSADFNIAMAVDYLSCCGRGQGVMEVGREFFGIGVGLEIQAAKGSSLLFRPKVSFDAIGAPVRDDDPIPWYPTASLSILWAP